MSPHPATPLQEAKAAYKSMLEKVTAHLDLERLAQFKAQARIQDRLKLPFLSRFSNETNEFSNVMISILDTKQRSENLGFTQTSPILNDFYFGGLVFAALDFIAIPMVFLAGFLLQEPVPLTLSKGMKWLYSAVILSLFITSILFPPAGLAIALAIGSLVVGVSSFLLAKTVYKRYLLRQELEKVNEEIQPLSEELNLMRAKVEDLQKKLEEATEENKEEIFSEITKYIEDFMIIEDKLVELTARKVEIEKERGEYSHLYDRGLSVFLASLTLAGLVVTLFFPPVGLALLATSTLIGATYLTGKLLHYGFNKISNYFLEKKQVQPIGHGSYHGIHHGFKAEPGSDKAPEAKWENEAQQSLDTTVRNDYTNPGSEELHEEGGEHNKLIR